MLVPSSKTTVTTESPNLETERTSSRPGSPLIDSSTGVVMKRSTSSGPSAGAEVRICTWMLVTSGTASMGSDRIALRPPTTSSAESARTRKRFLRDHSRIRSITAVAS